MTMISPMMKHCLPMMVCVLMLEVEVLPGAAATGEDVRFHLRPSKAFVEAQSKHGMAMPFFQAVPFAPGRLKGPDTSLALSVEGKAVPADVRPSAFWPDGSVQWLSIDGVWPRGRQVAEEMVASVRASAVASKGSPCSITVNRTGHTIQIIDPDGKTVAVLRPEAKVLRITEPKADVSQKPEDQDTTVQYAWAEKVTELNPTEPPDPLEVRVLRFVAERQTPVFTVYRARGDGGLSALGQQLEWQLRIRAYRDAPVIRFQMTWVLHWDPKQYALVSAKWVVACPSKFSQARSPGVKRELPLAEGNVVLTSTAPGRSRVAHDSNEVLRADRPDPDLHAWALKSPTGYLAVALPNFTRLGPNRFLVRSTGVDLASWDEGSGLALDLRGIVKRDEFGMGEADFGADAKGLARTLEMTWVWADSPEKAAATAEAEARRDGLWFASRPDLAETASIGPWAADAYERNRLYCTGLQAQVHFVLASRDYWRWNGFVNFGDIRTNWHRKGWPKGGLHALRWGMHGRYGWRNGSAEPYRGFLVYGLFVEDRDLVLGALDYALHVADVDVCHGRFGQKLTGDQGGMHRRNKQHWSGDVQMQYTTSRGLYLMRWLTGHERLADTLAEIRDYGQRHAGSSIFAAAAWLNHYTETRDPKDLATAERLLEATVKSWDGRKRDSPFEHLKAMAALYAGNFRAKLDCWPALIEFHRATGDPIYLDAILTSVRAHPMKRAGTADLSRYYAIAYLLANGISEDDIGTDKIARFRKALKARKYGPTIPRAKWHYESLVRSYRAVYQTAELGWQASFAPLVLRFFDSGDAE